MRYCPNCNANVEGLLHYCDCCGAPLDSKERFWVWHCCEFSCGFFMYVDKYMKEIEKIDASECSGLNKIELEFCCYPESVTATEKLKNKAYYSQARKVARVTVIVDYDEFIRADNDIKDKLVINAISQSLCLLKTRLLKSKINIDKLVHSSNQALKM